jgi:hypothetical protein
VQPCTRSGDGHGWRVWLRPRSPPAGLARGRRSVGNHGAGGVTSRHVGVLGFRVDCKSRRAVFGFRGKGAVVAVLDPRSPSRAASANRRNGTVARAATRGRERSSSALRRWKVLLVQEVVLAVHAAGRSNGVGPPWLTVAAKPVCQGGTRSIRGSSVGRPSGRECRSGGRHRGSKRVKRRELRHPPGLGDEPSAGSRSEVRVLIFDNWVARPLSTGHVRCRTFRKEPGAVESRRGRRALDGAMR